ncbi:MAG: hypothetical protein RIC55_16465 [Pirellulaceae bacterium]
MTATEKNIVELKFERINDQIQVVAPDKHIMRMPIQMAVAACRAFANQIEFVDQFHMLRDRLGDWFIEHLESADSAYLTTRDSGLLFLVVQKSDIFDERLADELTSLDLEISGDSDFALITLSVHAVPNSPEEAIASFLSKDMIIQFEAPNGD